MRKYIIFAEKQVHGIYTFVVSLASAYSRAGKSEGEKRKKNEKKSSTVVANVPRRRVIFRRDRERGLSQKGAAMILHGPKSAPGKKRAVTECRVLEARAIARVASIPPGSYA